MGVDDRVLAAAAACMGRDLEACFVGLLDCSAAFLI